MPLVSVIIPIYNTEDYVREALDSVINQTFKDIEILCINDGSTDGSLKILEDYAQKDNRIRIYSQENKGLPATKNVGVSLSKGKYITFVDSDDTISNDTIETSVKIAEEKDCDVVVNYLNLTNNYINKNSIERPWMSAPQPFMKKEVFFKFGIRFDEDLTTGEDIVFGHKLLALTNKVALNSDSYYFYRMREGQMTDKKNDSKFVFYIEQWLTKIEIFYNKHDLWEKRNQHLLNFIKTQPLLVYSSRNLTKEDRKQVFELIHGFIKRNNIETKIQIKRPSDFIFIIFLSCQKQWQYEPVRLFIRLFIKMVSKIKSKLRFIKGVK